MPSWREQLRERFRMSWPHLAMTRRVGTRMSAVPSSLRCSRRSIPIRVRPSLGGSNPAALGTTAESAEEPCEEIDSCPRAACDQAEPDCCGGDRHDRRSTNDRSYTRVRVDSTRARTPQQQAARFDPGGRACWIWKARITDDRHHRERASRTLSSVDNATM